MLTACVCRRVAPRHAPRCRALRPTHARPDIDGCQANAQVTIHTAFTGAECASFAQQYDSLAGGAVSYPTPLLCSSNNCNAIDAQVMISSAVRAAGVGAMLAAAALAAAVL
jgi:hypothetical protein